MGLATLWVVLGTDLVQTGSIGNGRALTPDELLIIDAVVIAFFALVLGYASVGALLEGRAGAGRIAALLLAGGAVFVLEPGRWPPSTRHGPGTPRAPGAPSRDGRPARATTAARPPRGQCSPSARASPCRRAVTPEL